jgi:hypothetical protein
MLCKLLPLREPLLLPLPLPLPFSCSLFQDWLKKEKKHFLPCQEDDHTSGLTCWSSVKYNVWQYLRSDWGYVLRLLFSSEFELEKILQLFLEDWNLVRAPLCSAAFAVAIARTTPFRNWTLDLFFSCQDPVSDIESKKSYENICNQIGHVSFVCHPPLSFNSRNMSCPSRFCNHFGELELSESSTIFCSFSCCHCEIHSIL